MSVRYLVIPRIQVQHANAMQAWWLMAPPSPMTVQGFSRAMGLHCGFRHRSIALCHHGVQWLAQEKNNWHSGLRNKKVLPQQQQGATFIDRQDHISSGFAKGLQPTARCHVEMSLILDLGESPFDSQVAKDFLWSARLGGGVISRHGEPTLCTSTEQATQKIGGGFWVVDRSDLVEQKMQKQHLSGTEAIISVLSENSRQRNHYYGLPEKKQQEVAKPDSWLSANVVGFAALENAKARIGIREGLLHAYAEPLVGLIQYRSLHTDKAIPFWQYLVAPEGLYFMKGN